MKTAGATTKALIAFRFFGMRMAMAGRNSNDVSPGAQLAVRNDARRPQALRGQYRCDRRLPYSDGETTISAPGERIVSLPSGPINHHWTKDVIGSPDGTKLYVTVGSNSNVGEKGMEVEKAGASILEIDLATRQKRVFASGLRNPNGLPGIRRTVSFGSSSTNATRSAATSFPTT